MPLRQVIALEPQNRQARIELKNLRETKERFMEMQAAAKAMDGSGNAAVFGGVAPMLGGMISQEPTLGGGMQGL